MDCRCPNMWCDGALVQRGEFHYHFNCFVHQLHRLKYKIGTQSNSVKFPRRCTKHEILSTPYRIYRVE